MSTTYPVPCPCGFTEATTDARRVSELLSQHQASTACRLSPTYLPPEERHRRQTSAAHATRRDVSSDTGVCTALTGRCGCRACTRAASDDESPMNLTRGNWINRRGVRAWEPTTRRGTRREGSRASGARGPPHL